MYRQGFDYDKYLSLQSERIKASEESFIWNSEASFLMIFMQAVCFRDFSRIPRSACFRP